MGKKLWTNGLWAVTPYGLECLYNDYHIDKERLWDNEPQHDWGQHLAQKRNIHGTNVALFAFLEAWQMARIIHAKHMPKGRTIRIPHHDYIGQRAEMERDLLRALVDTVEGAEAA